MNALRAITRHATNTLALAKYPGTDPHWVADMSFATPDPILQALKDRVDEGHFSYPHISESVYDSIQYWCKNRYRWKINREWIVIVPSVMSGVEIAVKSVDLGGPFFFQSPCYSKLYNLGRVLGLRMHEINVSNKDIPFKESDLLAIKKISPSAVVLCNPLNPTGTVSTREQLEELTGSVKNLNTVIISDESHADLILGGRIHTPAGSIEGLKEKSITILSPSKTFNLAGIAVAYAIIPSQVLRENFIKNHRISNSKINALGLVACEQGYFQCSDWLDTLIIQLKRNQELLFNELSKTSLEYLPAQATYLAWIDARNSGGAVFNTLLQNGIAVSDGHEFGAPGFIRFNFACPEYHLKKTTDTLLDLFGNSK